MLTKINSLKPIRIIFYLCLVCLLQSCIPLKDIKYIQPDKNLKLNEYGNIVENKPVYRLQKNDMISIRISTRDAEMLNMFNSYVVSGNTSGGNRGSGEIRIQEDGNIELPRVGKIYLEGLTANEARIKVEEEFYKIFKKEAAFIEVIIPGINFTIIGEAASGNYNVNKYELNLLEAIAMAGNLSDVADRKRIQILRTTPNGTHRVEVDITKESVMNSEYFWLQPNDIVIINPKRQKQWGIGINPIATVSTIFGAITTLVGIYFFVDRL